MVRNITARGSRESALTPRRGRTGGSAPVAGVEVGVVGSRLVSEAPMLLFMFSFNIRRRFSMETAEILTRLTRLTRMTHLPHLRYLTRLTRMSRKGI